MRHGSLFSGIGGFDLASEWMGWDNIFHCEWNEFGQRVLKHHFPKSISYGDITTTDFTIHRGQIDILTGGFPCQPYSQAGKRLGKEDDRHLWPEMLRAIREIQPRWVVGENVLGLVNWNGGLVFDEVQADLENEGHVVQPYVLPACAVNAPHRRDRVWFVAYSEGHNDRRAEREFHKADGGQVGELLSAPIGASGGLGKKGDVANTNGNGQHGCNGKHEIEPGQRGFDALNDLESLCGADSNANGSSKQGERFGQQGKREFDRQDSRNANDRFQIFPTQSPICGGDDGLPTQLDGITFSKWRQESVKAYGNAIVPQVAYQIFKAIEQYQCQASPSP
jgi:DNA (cytosine-5)-methyltransferase 1